MPVLSLIRWASFREGVLWPDRIIERWALETSNNFAIAWFERRCTFLNSDRLLLLIVDLVPYLILQIGKDKSREFFIL